VLSTESLFNSSSATESLFGTQSSPITAEEAFEITDNSTEDMIRINIIIQPKHYLYQHKIKLIVNEIEQDISINNAVPKQDEHYGEIKAIYDFLSINRKLDYPIESYSFQYQGCSEEFGICYPMQEIKVDRNINVSKNENIDENIKRSIAAIQALEVEDNVNNEAIAVKKIVDEEKEQGLNIIEEIIPTPVSPKNDIVKAPVILEEKNKVMEDKIVETTKKYEKADFKNETNTLGTVEKEGYFDQYIDTEKLTKTLSENSLMVTLGIFFLSGILISFTPCVLPMIPIISSIVVGNKKEVTQLKSLLLSISYVLGSSFTYAIIGAIAAMFSKNIQIYMQNSYVVGIFSLMLVVFAMSLFGFINISMPTKFTEKTTNISNKMVGGKYISVFFMGMISTLIVSPCVAAPLAAAITYITTDSGDILTGSLSLFSFGLGIGLVLIIITTVLNKMKLSNPTVMNESKYVSGTLILVVAIYMAERILPVDAAMYLYQILALSYFANTFARNYEKLKKLFILLVIMFAAVIYVNNAQHININIFKISEEKPVVTKTLKFKELTGIEDLKINNEFAIIKVTADWCTYCQTMEKDVFEKDEVILALKGYELIKLDLTSVSSDKEAIMKEMGVVAPPALFFFKDGEVMYKKVGAMSKIEMLDTLKTLREYKKVD